MQILGDSARLSKLGYFFKVRYCRHQGQCYFEPAKWAEVRQTLQDRLVQGRISVNSPECV